SGPWLRSWLTIMRSPITRALWLCESGWSRWICDTTRGLRGSETSTIEVPSQAVTVSAQASRQALLAYLGRTDVASQLHSLRVERTLAAQRVAAISDEEIDTLMGKLSSLPAAGQMSGGGTSSGGYAGGGSAFLVVLVLALLVVWLIYIATPRSPAETLNSSF